MFAGLKKLSIPFSIGLLGSLFFPIFLPSLRLATLAPFITLSYTLFPLANALWISFLVGLLFDFFTSQTPLGFFALNYCLTTVLVYSHSRRFYQDKPHMYALFTPLFSFVSTTINILMYALFNISIPIGWKVIGSDLIIMPLLDGLYAYIWCFGPIALIQYLSGAKFAERMKNSTSLLRSKMQRKWKKLRGVT